MEFDSLKSLLERNRSYRRFDESKRISPEELEEIVGLARLCASGRNLQPLKYRPVVDPEECAKVFDKLAWAGYLTDWAGPEKGERPAAYLVQCLDLELTNNPMCDEGLQLEALTLGAVAKGYGTCIIKSFNIPEVTKILGLGENVKPTHVVALGVPVEKVEIEEMVEGDVKYWRDARGVHHVPKRSLKDLII